MIFQIDFKFEGLCAATFAPMKENGDINVDAVPQYASFLSKNDIKGIYVNGTTGEGIFSLTVDERMELAEAWIKEKDKVPTQIMQVGGCAFRDAQKLAAHAEKIGNTAIGILPNMFTFPQNVDQLVDWVEGIASAAPNTPCLYYHIPSKTKVELSMVELMKKASERIPNFVGLKFTSRDCAEAGSCLLLKRPNGKPFKFFFGSDETYLGHYAFGIESAIGSSYNFVPQLFHQINKAVADNDIKKARELQFVNTNMFEILFKNGNPGLVQQKVAMKLLTGIDLGPARFPQIPMKPEHIKELEKDLREFKIHAFQK